MTDELYMTRCLELAKMAHGNCYPNPMVGSIIVHNGIIIGEGYHQKAGCGHAEINAINSVENPALLPESTMYVTLEPCAHYGKTPPCAEKLAEIGFKKVVIGAMDSHEKVNGKGKQILENAGIEVKTGVLETACREINKRFFTFHQKKRPYIILKWAQSADGFMDQDYKPVQIGNELTKQFVHQLRCQEHAILVGANTALHDNPSLTTREIEGRNPIRILIDPGLKVPDDFKIYNDEAPTLVLNTKTEAEVSGNKFLKVCKEHLLEDCMKILHAQQIQSVLVEGGSFTLQNFINAGLWDEAYIIKNENLLLHNGTKAPVSQAAPSETAVFRDNIIEYYKNT
ncbi:riboflavin biosynthesis protein RibD [Chryseobacterium sp. 6424]|uniref:bifunctional diaminohydroxyphosphoribosylaminopyrimidine deaminase/5-amino-6-(5-phosphoribosylamino)uracil reductase RibD n=1 Tax=Chryseobacterium sp. 6424 TaxID=2039166 RepID=UPI000EFBB2D2|nr:bifunctional diaminohydroxyphosphoribosylaminopyrimidine deaminase/5-amino-6-(5-phosphoribosylamino)uracil reductase RibD [Chryseobacterium sp. 6424]AYO58138.1 riboflavin biosynthesis protein RibD [Chryseobacterium sp. 6424]